MSSFVPFTPEEEKPIDVHMVATENALLRMRIAANIAIGEHDRCTIVLFAGHPRWPKGQTPDSMTNITGGITDGFGKQFQAPNGYGHEIHAFKVQGTWYWYVIDRKGVKTQ